MVPYAHFASSPVHKLPVELLSHIFDLTTHAQLPKQEQGEEDQSFGYGPGFDTESVQAPLLLSAVCQHWRKIALSTPSLWTSLCITPELFQHYDDGSSSLNFTPIAAYLQRSRRYPLNILIDARDQSWDFSEAGVTPDSEWSGYTPLFSSQHMQYVVSYLLPHLPRWKSLTILTDTWAPLHTALSTLQPAITTFGAPQLETLSLMRCNDFVSFSPEFQPSNLKEPEFLHVDESSSASLLPRLKHLSLRGAHLDWNSFSRILRSSNTHLQSIELSSHCSDVRPSVAVFQNILLSSSKSLRSLVITGSGPDVDGTEISSEGPITLSCLQELSVGYRDTVEAHAILDSLRAPALKKLVLEDATYPGDPEVVDASGIALFVGTGQEHSVAPSSAKSIFPALESLRLKSVKAGEGALRALFKGLPNTRSMELVDMSINDVDALLPASSSPSECPAPRLESLSLREFDRLDAQDVDFLTRGLSAQRQAAGGLPLRALDVHVASSDEASLVSETLSPSSRMKVTIVSGSEMSDEGTLVSDMESSSDFEMEVLEKGAFKLGGVFNDPAFDARYAGVFSAGTAVTVR